VLDFLNCWAIENEPLINLGKALIPVLITIFAVCIGYQQYKTNRRKLKLDLFDKRFVIFQAAKDFVIGVIDFSSFDKEKQNVFLIQTRGSQFVFGDDIKDYIDEIWDKFVDLEVWKNDEDSSTHSSEQNAHLKWFNAQLHTMDKKFESYLKLKH